MKLNLRAFTVPLPSCRGVRVCRRYPCEQKTGRYNGTLKTQLYQVNLKWFLIIHSPYDIFSANISFGFEQFKNLQICFAGRKKIVRICTKVDVWGCQYRPIIAHTERGGLGLWTTSRNDDEVIFWYIAPLFRGGYFAISEQKRRCAGKEHSVRFGKRDLDLYLVPVMGLR